MPDIAYQCPSCEGIFDSFSYEQDVSVNRTEYGCISGISESGDPYLDFHDCGDEYDWDVYQTRCLCEGCNAELCYDGDIEEFLANNPAPEEDEEEVDDRISPSPYVPPPKPIVECML